MHANYWEEKRSREIQAKVFPESKNWQDFNKGVRWDFFCPMCEKTIDTLLDYDDRWKAYKNHREQVHGYSKRD